jgi:phosphoglycolate phosphatase
MRRRLVLFDIDGTLLSAHGVGRRSLERAFAERFGGAGWFDGVRFHGRMDPEIVAEGVLRAGGGDDDVRDLTRRYLDHLETETRETVPTTLPGVADVLDLLASIPGTAVGLVTGNVRRGAAIKLAQGGLFARFTFGAFGDDAPDRGELVRIARRRAAEAGHDVRDPRDVFHVGDTENDVRAAKDAGATAVAVSTGGTSHEALEAERPDVLLRSLAPAATFVKALFG